MSLSTTMQISDQDVYQITTRKGAAALGQLAYTTGDRIFAYAKAGAVNLVAGKITQAPASVANDTNRTLSASFAQGVTQITVTLGGTATANQYEGGWLVVNNDTGQGQGAYMIVGNTAATAGTSNATTISLKGALNIAVDNTTEISLYPNLYSATVIMANASAPAIPVTGAPVINVTAANYYWTQVGGMASILSDGAITKNAGAISSNAIDGAVETEVAGTVTYRVGYAPELTVDTDYSGLMLTLNY